MKTRLSNLLDFTLEHLFPIFIAVVVTVGVYCQFIKPRLNSPKPAVVITKNFTNAAVWEITNDAVLWDAVMREVSNRQAQVKPTIVGHGKDAILWGGGARVCAVIDESYTIHNVVDYFPNHEPNCTLIRFVQDGHTNDFHAWLVSVRFKNE